MAVRTFSLLHRNGAERRQKKLSKPQLITNVINVTPPQKRVAQPGTNHSSRSLSPFFSLSLSYIYLSLSSSFPPSLPPPLLHLGEHWPHSLVHVRLVRLIYDGRQRPIIIQEQHHLQGFHKKDGCELGGLDDY